VAFLLADAVCWRKQRFTQVTPETATRRRADWRLAAELGKISLGLEFQAFAVVSTPLLLIPK
jgi:hypothetical protein